MSRWNLYDVPELRHVVAAVERGTRRSKLRILTVVCARNHTLFEVYRGSDSRLYAVALRNGAQGLNPTELVDCLDQPLHHDEDGRAIVGVATCRCHRGIWLRAKLVQEAIDAGRSRVALRRVVGE